MLNTWLSDSTIVLRKSVDSWQQALDICGKPLLDAGLITTDYLLQSKNSMKNWDPIMFWRRDWRCLMHDRKKGLKG